MNKSKPTYEELENRLAAAEPIVEALKHHEVDAIVGHEKIAILLVREVGEALVNSEAAFGAMFELPGIGMVQADAPAFRFTRVNQKFCEMAGYSAEELLTRTSVDLTDPRDHMRAIKAFAPVLRGKIDTWSVEKRYVRKDGIIIWVVVNGTVLRDDDGRVVRVLAMIRDVAPPNEDAKTPRDAKKELKKQARTTAVKRVRKSTGTKSADKARLKRR